MQATLIKWLLPLGVKLITKYISEYEKGTAIEKNWIQIVSQWQKKHSMPDDKTAAHQAAKEDITAWEKKRLEEIAQDGQSHPSKI